jgi:hypothetical protein
MTPITAHVITFRGEHIRLSARDISRFESACKIAVRTMAGCLLWTQEITPKGYGRFHCCGKNRAAHRLAYELARGPIPDGLVIDHLCRWRHCVNPDHMEPVTARINTLRGNTAAAQNVAKTHCKRGHPLSGDNIRMYRGERVCKACVAHRRTAPA